MALRETLAPYIMTAMQRVSTTGQPVNRPLFWDFPNDPKVWAADSKDVYMFGADMLVAPVTDMGARNRTLYLPQGASWQHYFTQKLYTGGQSVTVDAPLDEFPLFTRKCGQ